METVAIGVEDLDPRKMQKLLTAVLICTAVVGVLAYLTWRTANDVAEVADSAIDHAHGAGFDAHRARQAADEAIAAHQAALLLTPAAKTIEPATTEEPHA